MPHATEGDLHAYADGALASSNPEAAGRLAAHLEGCADCRARLEEASALRDRSDELLAVALGEPLPAPGFAEVAREAAARREATGGGAAPGRPSRGAPRLAWAASIVVALGAGWMAHAVIRGTDPDVLSETTAAFRARSNDAAGGDPAAAAGASSDAAPEASELEEDLAESARDQTASRQAPDPVGREAAPGRAANEAASTPASDPGAPPSSALRTQELRRETQEVAPAETEASPPSVDRLAEPAPKSGVGAAFADEGVVWTPVSLSAAAAEGPVLHVPGLEVLDVATAGEAGDRSLRVRQRLPGGETLVLVQSAGATDAETGAGLSGSRDADDAAARRDAAGEPQPGADGLRYVERRVGVFRIRAAAPVATDSLHALVSRLTSTTAPDGP